MHLPKIWLWQRAPALRLLVSFIAGILLQWYAQLPIAAIWMIGGLFLSLLLLFSRLPIRFRFKAAPLQGLALMALVVATAMCIVQQQDVRNSKDWFGKTNSATNGLLVTLQEPLVEKPNSFKALATVEKVVCNDSVFPASGKVILYFKKDAVAGLGYGSQVWVFEKVAPIKNSGNPAGFDYKRYSLFQGITHQVYLTATDFIIAPSTKQTWLKEVIFRLRERTITILKTHIQGARESGLAEALLIGYKDDLDKTLVQSYSNTGVVHIIAISGLHVGLIYALLLLLTKPMRGKRWQWPRFVLILAALWGFGVLAGAQPSVMRSVVMFSVLAAGVVLQRNTNIYNNLALSALLLLCYNPFWLWDVGFQLSYTAVLSIVIFFKPLYNLVYFQNKALDAVWKLMAVTLAAQVLTTPISLYYFHQFPLLFLFTNLLAVPLSSLVLVGELLICLSAFVAPVAHVIGWVTTFFIRLMNGYIERLEILPFAVWQGISISALQALLLLLFIIGISVWLLEKKRSGLWFGLSAFLFFTLLRTISFLQAAQQQTLIVYNISRHQAIDVFSGQEAWFLGDKELGQEDAAVKLHLQPSRVAHRIHTISNLHTNAFTFCNKRVLVIDTTIALQTFSKPHIDVLVLSKNPKLYVNELATAFDIAQIVIDASVPRWKAKLWQQDCKARHLPCHDVTEKGAFVMPVPRPTFAAL
jgi:competence protein ComEC